MLSFKFSHYKCMISKLSPSFLYVRFKCRLKERRGWKLKFDVMQMIAWISAALLIEIIISQFTSIYQPYVQCVLENSELDTTCSELCMYDRYPQPLPLYCLNIQMLALTTIVQIFFLQILYQREFPMMKI